MLPEISAELERAIAEVKRQQGRETMRADELAPLLPEHLQEPFWELMIDDYFREHPGDGEVAGVAEAYTLTQADVDGCRKILARLEELDAQTGGYRVGSVQGHTGSATATVHYARKPGPLATSEAVQYALDQVANLGLLCKKVIAHHETNGAPATPEQQQRAEIAETIVEAAQVLRYALRREPVNVDANDQLADFLRLVDLYDELEPADGEVRSG